MTRRERRKITYLVEFWAWQLLLWPNTLALKNVHHKRVRSGAASEYKCIRLLDARAKPDSASDFLEITQEALALIERHSPRHFRRIQQEVRCIVNTDLASGGNFDRFQHHCQMDFKRYKLVRGEAHYEWHLALYAAALVHEATHGRLFSLGFAYNKHTRVRAERICRAEERRFAHALPGDRYNFRKLIPEFKEADWSPYWAQNPYRFHWRTRQT
jgi:hypothetical protein